MFKNCEYCLIEFSSYAQQFGSLVIAILGLIHFSKREKPFIILGFYGLNSVIFQTINSIFPFEDNRVGNVYTLAETLILLYFFYALYNIQRAKRFAVILGAVYTALYWLLMRSDWPGRFGGIRTLRDLLMIGCSLLYFYFLMKDMPTTEITKYPLFWIVSAFIFFFAGTFVLSLSMNYLISVLNDDLGYLWPARNFFRFFFCMVVSYGLWLDLQSVRQRIEH